MKYRITYTNDFNEKEYFCNSKMHNKGLARHLNVDSWTVDDLDSCILVLKDFLDVPDKPLTAKQIRLEFGSATYPITDEQLKEIKCYYNGRLKLYNRAIKTITTETTFDITFDIPEKYNTFCLDKNFKAHQNLSTISILTVES